MVHRLHSFIEKLFQTGDPQLPAQPRQGLGQGQQPWESPRARWLDIVVGMSIRPATYASPVLDDVARRAYQRLLASGEHGMTVASLAEEIEANPSTLDGVLRGKSATYGGDPFERCGKSRSPGRPMKWRAVPVNPIP